jgi:aspartyl-tRNA(Asn)/glutamyl-tRNA(Gln) amidotransferase subunit C
MSLTPEEVEKIAKLARLKFDAGEKQKLQTDLTNILNYVDQIKSLGDQVEAVLVDDPDAVNLMRDDIAQQVENPEKFLEQAPGREGNFVKVKSILE